MPTRRGALHGFRLSLAIGLVCGVFGADGRRTPTTKGPVLVIPGRPGIPVVINGYDASYTIVEGDWGLARPGQVSPVIVSGPLITAVALSHRPLFPVSQGRGPAMAAARSSRRRIGGGRARRRAIYREWGAESQQLPADDRSAAHYPANADWSIAARSIAMPRSVAAQSPTAARQRHRSH